MAWAATRWAGGALVAAVLVACSSKPSNPPAPPVSNQPAVPEATMPQLTSAADISTLDGQVVTARGVYEVENLGRYRLTTTLPDGTVLTSNQAVYLKLADGTDLRVGARPDDERAANAGKTVEIEARLVAKPEPDDPRANQMQAMPTLVDVAAVRLSE
ncbi:MAG: hypothetical protein R3B06_27420 [Kofleriaceae bacterium]